MIRSVNKELFVLIIGRIAQVIIMLIALKVSTTLLTPLEMGNFYLILSFCSFFGFFFINPIGQYVNRKTYEWHSQKQLLNKMFNYNYYIMIATVLSFFVVVISYKLGIGTNIEYKWLILFVPLYVFFNTWNQTIIPMINMLEQRILFIILTIATLILSLAFSYIMISYYEQSGIFWLIGQIIGLGLMAVIGFVFFIKKIDSNLDIVTAHNFIKIDNFKLIMSFAIPLAVSVFFVWMQSQSYRLLIEKYIGAEFLGYFGVGMAIAVGISSSFETVVMQFLYPKMYKNMKNEQDFEIVFSNIINTIVPIYFLLAICVSFLAIYLTTILVSKEYSSSFLFVIFGIWIEFFRMSSNLLSTAAHSKMQTRSLILPYMIGGIIVFIGTYLASQSSNYHISIPLILIFSGLIVFLMMIQKMNKLVKINFLFKKLILMRYALVFVLALLVSEYSKSIYFSAIIVFIFGIYFLYVLNKIIRKDILT